MTENSMAWTHATGMAPMEMTHNEGIKALLIVNAARHLQNKLSLSSQQAALGLQGIDTRLSFLGDTCPRLPVCLLNKYRTFDGTCNNLRQPSWGSARSPLERLAPPEYDDGIWEPKIRKAGKQLPNVRLIRNVLVTDGNYPAVDMTHMFMQSGQFVDHDMVQVPQFRTANQSNIECCTADGGIISPEMRHPHCFPIDIQANDPFYGPRRVRCLNFVRSMIAPRIECRMGYADQMNQLTHFIDASHETRRIVGALMQHVTYNEFLPSLLGRTTMDAYGLTPQTIGYSSSYDENANPSITNEFATAAFRMGHSLIQGAMNLVEEDGKVRVELMRNWFNNPSLLRQAGILDAVLRGMIDQWPRKVDEWVSEDVTNHLFQRPKKDFGLDLLAINIWRGRDHGLPGYNTYRQVCGLPPLTNFPDLLDVMDRSVVDRLASVYGSVNDIDLYIGGLVERHLPGSMLGPVFSSQLQEIRKMSLAAIICDNADHIFKVQLLVFRHPSPTNLRVNCQSSMIPRMNLAAWIQ
ncbi:hypothetical protein DAPPUDRAFT_240129 [Daphnia pulex]|uniref:Chorion peroxidase n=1 Tax=Daphnia pulex TaxID=6669 RepID=E9GAY2_DAPPU|nr:hypothetical protein DAPPUDRAFT_240129 [Daphnia pulex]|eukprot:EFX83339.1 hypothetical protein DAPPUDRAFT_240129 [Daphnia pulex]